MIRSHDSIFSFGKVEQISEFWLVEKVDTPYVKSSIGILVGYIHCDNINGKLL